MPIRTSDDVVRVRQTVRDARGRGRLQPGRSDQDRHRGERDRPQHRRLRRRRHDAPRDACATAAPRAPPHLRRPGPGHRRPRRWRLKDGYTIGDGLGLGLSGAKRLCNEFEIKSTPGTGHQGDAGALDAENVHRRRRSQPGWRGPPAGRRTGASHRVADRQRIDQVALVATELATNLLKHGGGGHIHAGRCDDAEGTGLELLALGSRQRHGRSGPLHAGWLLDRREPRHGLGAIARLVDRCAIFTRPGWACAVLARFRRTARRERARIAAWRDARALSGRDVCPATTGPGATPCRSHDLVVDGSGHGVEAARAARVRRADVLGQRRSGCVGSSRADPSRAGADARRRCGGGAHRYRGAGGALRRGRQYRATLVDEGKSRHMVSHNGTAGHVAPRIREFTYRLHQRAAGHSALRRADQRAGILPPTRGSPHSTRR